MLLTLTHWTTLSLDPLTHLFFLNYLYAFSIYKSNTWPHKEIVFNFSYYAIHRIVKNSKTKWHSPEMKRKKTGKYFATGHVTENWHWFFDFLFLCILFSYFTYFSISKIIYDIKKPFFLYQIICFFNKMESLISKNRILDIKNLSNFLI